MASIQLTQMKETFLCGMTTCKLLYKYTAGMLMKMYHSIRRLEETHDVTTTSNAERIDIYEGVSKSFRTESITKYTLTKINTR